MWIKKFLFMFVLLSLCFSAGISSEVTFSDEQLASLRLQLRQAKKQFEDIKMISVISQQDLERVKKLLKQKESEIQSILETLNSLKASLQIRNEEIEKLLTESEQFKKDLEGLRLELMTVQDLLTESSRSLQRQKTISIVLGTSSLLFLVLFIVSVVFG